MTRLLIYRSLLLPLFEYVSLFDFLHIFLRVLTTHLILFLKFSFCKIKVSVSYYDSQIRNYKYNIFKCAVRTLKNTCKKSRD